jgi:formate dehydrogenase major subunit
MLRRIDYHPTLEIATEDFPFLLVTGRSLYHFNAGTMTQRTANTILHPHDFLDISPTDGSRLNVSDGTRVTIRSRHGKATLVARLNPDIRQGELFCTFHDPDAFVNRVTSPIRDKVVKTPEYKVTAVQIEIG